MLLTFPLLLFLQVAQKHSFACHVPDEWSERVLTLLSAQEWLVVMYIPSQVELAFHLP